MEHKIKLNHFYRHKSDLGYIAFICKDYCTLVVRESEDKETINGVRQTKVIINRSEWNHMESVKKEVVADLFPHLNIKEE